MKQFIALLVAFVVLIVTGLVAAYFVIGHAPAQNEVLVYELQPGRSLRQVAEELAEKGAVRNAVFFEWFARLSGSDVAVKRGEYEIPANARPEQVLAIITSGKSLARKMTISEGLNLWEIAQVFASAGIAPEAEFLKYAFDPEFAKRLVGEPVSSLEGYLFPETYQVTKFTKLDEILKKMVDTALTNLETLLPQAQKMGLSRHQLLTFASIVEKETGAAFERPIIAQVFHNRLTKGMRLQTDPTVLYAKRLLQVRSTQVPNITREDLRRDHPYNTYTQVGLPPGPIASPGLLAMQAVVAPDRSSRALFFVSRNDGTHVFSETYEQHRAAVRDYQLNPQARQGKSWRDLNQKSKDSGGKD